MCYLWRSFITFCLEKSVKGTVFCTWAKNLSLGSGKKAVCYSDVLYICTPRETVAGNSVGNGRNFKIMHNSERADFIVDVLFNRRIAKIFPGDFENLWQLICSLLPVHAKVEIHNSRNFKVSQSLFLTKFVWLSILYFTYWLKWVHMRNL